MQTHNVKYWNFRYMCKLENKYFTMRDADYRVYSDILDISMTEYFVLLELSKRKEATPRKFLLDLLNKRFNDPKAIHPSSYYKRLERLEKKGLIKYVDTKSVRNQTIMITDFGYKCINDMLVFSLLSLIDIDSIAPEIISMILPKLRSTDLKRTLIINMDVIITSQTLNLISDLSEQTFLLATQMDYELSRKSGLSEDILQSDYLSGHIREANEVFDAVIILGYGCSTGSAFDIHSEVVIEEARRVLGSGGLFMILGVESMENSNNMIAQIVKRSIENTLALGHDTLESFFTSLRKFGLKDIDGMSISGTLAAWGYKD